MQEAEGTLFPISYISKKLNEAEQNYSTSEKKCLAIVWAIKKFRNYIHGTELIIETDHDSLQYLDTFIIIIIKKGQQCKAGRE